MQMNEAKRKPPWLNRALLMEGEVLARKNRIARMSLHTVCESARCPNISACFAAGNATFLILGDRCTRNCAFCAVAHGIPEPPDAGEGRRIARYMKGAGVRFAVITSVTRDDLDDGGAGHFARVVLDIRKALPSAGLEILVPDFAGNESAMDSVFDLPIHVLGHNMETVRSLYPTARKGADFRRSLRLLHRASAMIGDKAVVKSGVMVGLGESREELLALFHELAESGVHALTIGQYLRPGRLNVPVARYAEPSEFEDLAEAARASGIPSVLAGPYVRSSYMAEEFFRERRARGGPKPRVHSARRPS
jgi:lipoic acid synthetase